MREPGGSRINVLILRSRLIEQGYGSQRWLTYRQAQPLGGDVRKGGEIDDCRADELTPQVLAALVGQARRVMPITTKLRPMLRDPADDMVLECAVQAGADAMVTMNVRDFLPARELYRVDVMKPGDLHLRLERGEAK